MKIKIGSFTEEITVVNNEIFENQIPKEERLYVEIKNHTRSITDISSDIIKNSTEVLTVIYNDGTEESFNAYTLESIRKTCEESTFPRIGIDFIKRDEI